MMGQGRFCDWRAWADGRGLLSLAFGGMLLLALTGPAWAAQVFEQPPGGGNDAFPSFLDDQSADDFLLSADAAVTQVRWWGSYLINPGDPNDPGVDDLFHVRFFNDAGGVPATDPSAEFMQPALNVSRTATALQDAQGGTVFQFDATLPSPVDLEGGTPLHLSIVNFFDATDAEWFWLLSDPTTGNNAFRFGDGNTWTSDSSGDLAFALATAENPPTAVSEPSIFGIFAAGLLLLVGTQRSRLRGGVSERVC